MKYEQTINVTKEAAQQMQEILDREEAVEDVKSIFTFGYYSTHFSNGAIFDLKVCNGNPPYVDATLFIDGEEVAVDEPGENFLDETHIEFDGDEYIVKMAVYP